MEKQIINGLKMLQTKIKYNKFIFLVILTFLTPGAVFSSQPIAYLNTSGYEPAQQETAQGKNGMITTQHFLATAVGEKILNKGGNAYDASIAIAFTLAVVLPRAGNIGGGGFMVMYDKDTDNAYSIDYREKAPALAYKDMYLNDDGTFNDKKLSTFGYLSSGVPGTVAGMWEVHKKFGSLPWSELLKDAIYYAENGFKITPYMEDVLKNYNQKLSYYPETKSINSYVHNSPEYINILGEVMKHAYSDRSKYLGDPDFFDVPIKKITSETYAEEIYTSIEVGISTPSEGIHPGMFLQQESHETTHFSVADRFGNVVSSTYTLNSTFGSGVVIEGTGILMNNEMDDFSSAPGIPNQFGLLGSEANEIAPYKRPLSSMTPTIVMKDNELFFTTGSPGGARIISAVLQSILNIIDFEMNLEEATKARRIHHQWQPDVLEIEYYIDDKASKELIDMGYSVKIRRPLTCIQTIMYKDGKYYGYGDFRRPDAYASGNIND